MTSNKLVILVGYGGWLHEEHVVKVLARFSMPNTDLALYHRKTDLTSVEALNYPKTLHITPMDLNG